MEKIKKIDNSYRKEVISEGKVVGSSGLTASDLIKILIAKGLIKEDDLNIE